MRSFLPLCAGLVLGIVSLHAAPGPLPVGAPAPAITALDQTGKPLRFADVYARGTTLVYFYPKAFTGGCTAEACSLRDSYQALAAQGLQVIGVSRDTAATQAKFQEANHLPFTLVADTEGKVAAAFGVPNQPVDARESFLIKDGRIVWNSPHAQTRGAADEVRKALATVK